MWLLEIFDFHRVFIEEVFNLWVWNFNDISKISCSCAPVNVFWNKGYGILISAYDVVKKV